VLDEGGRPVHHEADGALVHEPIAVRTLHLIL
jgi:hypothetical protein